MKPEKDVFITITPKIILGQLFKSRDIMHIVHLRTTSFAVHKATEAYYTSLLDLTDHLAETHFGIIGVADVDDIPPARYTDPTQHLNDMVHYLSSHKKLFTTSAEQSIIDEILALMYKTLYLLTLS